MTRLAQNRSANRRWRKACGRFAAGATAVCALLLGAAFAAEGAGDKEVPFEPVVPPGQDDVLAALLGRAAVLPAECRFAGGGADGTIIRGTYGCPSGEVVYELTYPDNADDTATKTERFAITLRSGAPPAGLEDALVSLIRYREHDFEWLWLSADGDE